MVALAPRIPKTHAWAWAPPHRNRARQPLPLAATSRPGEGLSWRGVAYAPALEVKEGAASIADYFWAGQRVAKRVYPNGIRLEAFYDGAKRVTDWKNLDALGADKSTFGYAYDKAHNRKFEKRVHDAKGDVYRYDGIYELTAAKYGVPIADILPTKVYTDYLTFDREQTWEYDGVGNRKTMVDAVTAPPTTDTLEYNRPAGGGAYAADSVNRIYRIRKNGGDTNRVHDANGNLTNDGTNTFSYNYKNELIEVRAIIGGLLVQQQNFNSSGQRIYREASPPVYMVGVWMLGHPAEDIDGTGATLASYVVAAGQLLTSDIGGVPHYCIANQDESVAAWTAHGTAGTIEETAVYKGYGEPTITSVPPPPPGTPNASKFARDAWRLAEWDLASGSFSAANRTYEPGATGRFGSRAAAANRLGSPYAVLSNELGRTYAPGGSAGEARMPEPMIFPPGPYCIPVSISVRHSKGDSTQDPIADMANLAPGYSQNDPSTTSNGVPHGAGFWFTECGERVTGPNPFTDLYMLSFQYQVDIEVEGDCNLCTWGQRLRGTDTGFLLVPERMPGQPPHGFRWMAGDSPIASDEYTNSGARKYDEGNSTTGYDSGKGVSHCQGNHIWWVDAPGIRFVPGRTNRTRSLDITPWVVGSDGSHLEGTFNLTQSVTPDPKDPGPGGVWNPFGGTGKDRVHTHTDFSEFPKHK